MTPRSSYVLVGVFVLMLGAALIAGLLWLTTGGPPRDYAGYLVYMTESVSGLNVDAEVKYRGVSVGRVSEVKLDPENFERVRIVLLVLEDIPIKTDTVATLELQGITGIAIINLTGGSTEAGQVKRVGDEEYPIIASRPSLLMRLDDSISELFTSIKETSDRMAEMLNKENQATITATLHNAESMTASLSARADELTELMANTNTLVSKLDTATARLPDLVDQFTRTAGALEAMATNMADAADTLLETSSDLKVTVASSGADVRAFTSSALPQASQLVQELKITAGNLRAVSESLQDDPSRVLFGGPEREPGPGEK
ncbi:MAG: MlaD family protein [Gammaproteobacteria bacterium]